MTDFDFFFIGSICIPILIFILEHIHSRNNANNIKKKVSLVTIIIWFLFICGILLFGKITKTPSAILAIPLISTEDTTADSTIPSETPYEETCTKVSVTPKPTETIQRTSNNSLTAYTIVTAVKSIEPLATKEPAVSDEFYQSIAEKELTNPKFGEYCYLLLGEYPQKEDKTIEPILWVVLCVSDEGTLLISNQILFTSDIIRNGNQAWIDTNLYTYLNSTFLRDAFTETERNCIMKTNNGSIFLLSPQNATDSLMGFIDNSNRKATQTEYALKQESSQENAWWLLPDIDIFQSKNKYVKANGIISSIGKDENLGVRPVCIIDQEKYTFQEGEGTLEDPYRMD